MVIHTHEIIKYNVCNSIMCCCKYSLNMKKAQFREEKLKMKSKMVQLFLSSFIKSSHERAGDFGMLSVAVNFIYHVWFGQKDRSILNLSLQLYLLISELYSVCVVEATLTRGEGPLLYCFEIKQQRFFHMTDIYRLLCDLHYVGRCFESEGDFLHT